MRSILVFRLFVFNMKKSGIYGIFNIINGKVYIGSTGASMGFNKRWKTHKICLSGGYHKNDHLQNSWDKYGEENFEFRIIEECIDDVLLQREDAWIRYYESNNRNYGYNLKEPLTHKHSEETKRKLSILHSGKKNPMYGIKLIGENNGMYGKRHTKETCLKMSKVRMGVKKSKTHRLNISRAHIGKPKPYSWKKVKQYDLNGNFIKEYCNIDLAGKETNIAYQSISACCNNRRKTAGKFKWSF